MAKEKKSFLLYCDLIHTINQMPSEKAGELFKHILSYVNDENPITNDLIIQLTFEPIKQSLKRDLQKYEQIRAKNIDNANKRWNKNNATASDRMPNNAKHAVSDSVNVSVSVSDSVNEIKENTSLSLESDFVLFWDKYGKKNDYKKCKDKFLKLKKSEIDNILNVVDAYVKSTPDVKYRKNPLTWLNGQCWKDVMTDKPKTITESGERIIKYTSNVNHTPAFLPESKFLEMQKRNLAGGYIYKILN